MKKYYLMEIYKGLRISKNEISKERAEEICNISKLIYCEHKHIDLDNATEDIFLNISTGVCVRCEEKEK